jgi:uncharacterized protein (TIGR02246 family)
MTIENHVDQQAIEQVIRRFEQAWNDHDARAFASVFAEDADFTNVFGREAQGRTAIEQFHAPMFSTMFKNSRFTPTDTKVRFIRPDVAAVDIHWVMSGATDPNGHPWPDRKGLINVVMTRENGEWAILVMHNMDLPALNQ